MRRAGWLLLLAATLTAQTDRATLTGTVVDPSKTSVQGAKIKLTAFATGVERVATTNAVGAYSLLRCRLVNIPSRLRFRAFRRCSFGRSHSK